MFVCCLIRLRGHEEKTHLLSATTHRRLAVSCLPVRLPSTGDESTTSIIFFSSLIYRSPNRVMVRPSLDITTWFLLSPEPTTTRDYSNWSNHKELQLIFHQGQHCIWPPEMRTAQFRKALPTDALGVSGYDCLAEGKGSRRPFGLWHVTSFCFCRLNFLSLCAVAKPTVTNRDKGGKWNSRFPGIICWTNYINPWNRCPH